jgi:hypothetical protein
MRYLSFALVLLILLLLPPRSRVVDPSKCVGYISGMCLSDDVVPIEQIVPDTGGDS